MVKMFQSLLGFLIRCDIAKGTTRTEYMYVSIPIGFSNTLRHPTRTRCGRDVNQFQSLLGFLIRCDYAIRDLLPVLTLFQSLLGFLIRCDAGWMDTRNCRGDRVSIPIGFSNTLRHSMIRRLIDIIASFNPYWVF